jgi:hypothetical protein
MAKSKTTTKTGKKSENKTGVGVKSKAAPSREVYVHDEILGLVDRTENEFLDLAELLHEAFHGDYPKKWGFDDFRSWASAELRTGYRKSMYMVDIWNALKKLGADLPREEIQALGWTKAKEIAHVITTDNVGEWLERAKKLSCLDLTEQVKIHRQRVGDLPDRPTLYAVKFKLTEEQNGSFVSSLKHAKALLGENATDSDAITHICMDWMQTQGTFPEYSSMQNVIDWVESCFDVKLSWEVTPSVSETQEKASEAAAVKEKANGGGAPDEDMDEAPKPKKDIKDLLGY